MSSLTLKYKHALVCGDGTDRNVWAMLCGDDFYRVCLTDPPYGLGDSKTEKNAYLSYDDTPENLQNLIDAFIPLAQEFSDVVVVTPGNKNQYTYPRPTWTMAWFTPAGVGRGPWGFCCWQPILCYGKDPKLSRGAGSFPDALVHSESADDVDHPCSKPVMFWEWLMNRVSHEGDMVVDPFAGSGTGLVASERTGRCWRGVEMEPLYCDVICARWKSQTNTNAVKVSAKDLSRGASDA